MVPADLSKAEMTRRDRHNYHFGVDGMTLTARPWANSVNYFVGQILMNLRPEGWEARFTCFTRRSEYSPNPALTRAPVDWDEPAGQQFTWRHMALPLAAWRSKVDVMWFPFHTVPLFIGTPSVVTIHDISFVTVAHHFDWRTRLYLGFLLQRALAQASRIITISQFTADELMRIFSVPFTRIKVIHHGFTEYPSTPGSSMQQSRVHELGLYRPYFLFLDGANPRKNLTLLIKMLRQTPHLWCSDLQFVITGNSAAIARILEHNDLGGRVGGQILLPGIVTTEELNLLYSHAQALLYLSEYEGFGLPILEAFARRCPVVALKSSSLPEVAGDGALFVEPSNILQLKEALKVLLDAGAREQMIALGLKQGRRFNWGQAADELCQTLVEAAKSGK